MTEFETAPPTTPQTQASGGTVSRRSLLHGATFLGMSAGLGGLLAACTGSGSSSSSSSSSGGARKGGTLTMAVDGTSAVIDPAYYSTLGDWMAVDCVFRGLTFIAFDGKPAQPDLASTWNLSADGLTYTFTLRQGVTFHDGSTLTSADVLASLNRQFNPDDPTLPKGAARPAASLGANVTSLTAPDASTVVMVLKTPDTTVPDKLSDIGGRVISKAALDKYGADIGKHPVGTGPFAFVSATSGQSVQLKAFDKFRLGRPPIDSLVLQQVQDPSTIISSLLSGDISVTQFTPYSAIKQLKSSGKVTVHDTPNGFDAIMLIDARRPAVAELPVRQAINLAIDRKQIIKQAFFGVAQLPDGYAIPAPMAGYDKSLADLSATDVAKAKQLLASVGATGRTVHLMAASDSWHPRAQQIIAQNLTDIGLKVVTTSVDPATYFGRVIDPTDPDHDLMIWERNTYISDADDMVGAMADPSGVYGDFSTGFTTLAGAADFPAKLEAARNLPVGAERTAAYSAIQRTWAENYMVLSMLCYSTNPVATGKDVSGVNVNALANHRCFMEKASI